MSVDPLQKKKTRVKYMDTTGLMHNRSGGSSNKCNSNHNDKCRTNRGNEQILIGRAGHLSVGSGTRGIIDLNDPKTFEYKPMDLTEFKKTRDAMFSAMQKKSTRFKNGQQLHKQNTIVNKDAASKFKGIVKNVGSNYTKANLNKQAHFVNLNPMYE